MEGTKYRLLLAGLLLITGCSIPFYDRAEIVPGPTINGGVSLTTGNWTSGHPTIWEGPFGLPYIDSYLGITGTFRVNYGISERIGLLFQPSLGAGKWLAGPTGQILIYDIQLGAKFRTSEHSALQTTLGYPSLLDLWYLHDFNQNLTGTAGIGFRGISLGLTAAIPLKSPLHLYLAGNIVSGWEWLKWAPQTAASLGMGLGFKPRR
ncbi:MAG: hypothetical protein ACUVUD_06050 [bacterium]